jgi:hypothetical protein
MLIKFRLRNYKTFREQAEWTLVASADDTYEADNVIETGKDGLRLLRSAAVYGANASGKSKLIDGIQFMRELVLTSSKDSQQAEEIPVQPFRLSTQTEKSPSEFEVSFLSEGVRYRYGFEVSATHIVAEWLFHRPKTKEVPLFYREGQDFTDTHATFKRGIVNELIRTQAIRKNTLLLSAAAQWNQPIASKVLNWFKRLGIVSGIRHERFKGLTMHLAGKSEYKVRILEWLQAADLGITDFVAEEFDELLARLPADAREQVSKLKDTAKPGTTLFSDILTAHIRYDDSQQPDGQVMLSMVDDESTGTGKFFSFAGPILDTLDAGDVLVIDEFDAQLHPSLALRIMKVFNSAITNPNNAQLLINTHDTNLLEASEFRRDQIWFTKKDRYGASTLYSLAEFTGVAREEKKLEQYYLQGRFGGVPYLGDFDKLSLPQAAASTNHAE